MTFETTIEGIPARVTIVNGSCMYSVRVCETEDMSFNRSFDTIEAAETAVKRYNLSQRKGFTNPTAFRRGGEQVQVTSICDGGKECWIVRADGRREKTSLVGLYSDAVAVHDAVQREKQLREDIVRLWNGVANWAPQWPNEGARQ